MKNSFSLFICLLISILLPLTSFTQTQIGSSILGEHASSELGFSVSLSSDAKILASGVPSYTINNTRVGLVRIYELTEGEWHQIGNNILGDSLSRTGRSVSLSSDGKRVAIGAPGNSERGRNSGTANILEWNGSRWVQMGSNIYGESINSILGFSISLSADGNRLAIGAPGNTGNNAGKVEIYEWDGNNWIQVGSDILGEFNGDEFGHSLSLSADGNRLAVGARNNDGNMTNSGHARVYQWNGNDWVQLGNDIDGEAAGDLSGVSISLSGNGDRVAIGAHNNSGNGEEAGHVRIYDWDGINWRQTGIDLDGDAAGDLFGIRLDLSSDGNRVAVGAVGHDGNGNRSGLVRVFEWKNNNWEQVVADITGDRSFAGMGSSVSISSDGGSVAVGASGHVNRSGQIKVFDIECTPSSGIDTVIACAPYTWIDGITYTESTTSPTYILNSINKCDSVVSLDLTINPIDVTVGVSVINNSPALIANGTEGNYQWINCEDNFNAIVGETNKNFVPKENGSYAVIIDNNGCVDTSMCFNILNVNIDNNSFNNAINVYPNPTHNEINIDLGAPFQNLEVRIYNLMGQVVYRKKYATVERTFITAPLDQGVYYLSIRTTDGKHSVTKIIKK